VTHFPAGVKIVVLMLAHQQVAPAVGLGPHPGHPVQPPVQQGAHDEDETQAVAPQGLVGAEGGAYGISLLKIAI
jgi:hypothetical protein